MRKVVSSMLMGALLMGLGIGIAGCSDESTEKTQTTIKTPEGKRTETVEKKVETSGDQPPAKNP